MNLNNHLFYLPSKFNKAVKVIIFIAIVMLMCNLNAVVDAFLHPDIPYFDKEHLIVGGVNGLVSLILLGLLEFYLNKFFRALRTIRTLEAILPICANCKKIRRVASNPQKKESWQTIESYITEKTTTKFSHSICPECSKILYPDLDNHEH